MEFLLLGAAVAALGRFQNTVTMSGEVMLNMMILMKTDYSRSKCTVTGNHVIISGGSINSEYVLGGYGIKGDTTGNTVFDQWR